VHGDWFEREVLMIELIGTVLTVCWS
jgi:hypothetical protein